MRVKSEKCKLLSLDKATFTRILGNIEKYLKKDYSQPVLEDDKDQPVKIQPIRDHNDVNNEGSLFRPQNSSPNIKKIFGALDQRIEEDPNENGEQIYTPFKASVNP